ncbi:lebercilin isoform X2 [Amia ocellicauda]|uniref:lebercilin isoform X2 n=1 Tax=Amia ocellicauda TaxID=2972642 RepID=UPI003463F96C
MDSQNTYRSQEDNRQQEKSQPSRRSLHKYSDTSFKTKYDKNKEKADNDSPMEDRSRTRTRDPDRDCDSDCEKNSDSYYSDDYDNGSCASDRSRTPSSRSPSLTPRREGHKKRICSSPPRKQVGMKKSGSRTLTNRAGGQRRWGIRSQSLNKESPPKDLDLVTKRVLSARLLKINELKSELTELQLRLDGLQKENKVLRQLQHRQEKALNKFDNTENEISQLISRHGNEVRTLRERLRRAQERERTTDKRLKEVEEELYRSKSTVHKLRRLVDDRQLAEREELAHKLSQAEARLENNDHRIKDLERNLELSNSSFQRQLMAEKKKTHDAQEEVKKLQEELERRGQKLKDKERELDAKNIYANRMLKPSPKKDTDNTSKKNVPSRNSTKSVQTDDNLLCIEFPTPPPAITDGTEDSKEDDYLSLKSDKKREQRLAEEWQRTEKEKQERERQREREEQLKRDQELHALEEKAKRLREDNSISTDSPLEEPGLSVLDKWEKEEDERQRHERRLLQEQRDHEEWQRRAREPDQQSRERVEEEQHKKEQLLARMREIDQESGSTDLFSGVSESKRADFTQRSAKPHNQTPTIFSFTEPVENLHNGLPSQGSKDSLKKPDSAGRRGIKARDSSEDLTFGSYAPSFAKAPGRSAQANQRGNSAEGKNKDSADIGFGKDKKSSLMQQLFGPSANTDPSSKMEILSPPSTSKAAQGSSVSFPWEKNTLTKKKEAHLLFNEDQATGSNKSRLQVAESRPAVKAINSFEDEIEEVTL